MKGRELLEAALLVLIILIMVFAMVFSFSLHLRKDADQITTREDLEAAAVSLPAIPEQERLPEIKPAAVDNFIEEEAVRSSTGPSEPHRGEPEGISAEDRDLVERIVMAEAGAEPYPGIIAVAQVILDQSREWSISIRETCTVPGRFTEPYAGEVSDLVRTAVHEVFDLGVRVTDEPITHFHNPTVDPYWAHTLTFVTRIGDHLFYR